MFLFFTVGTWEPLEIKLTEVPLSLGLGPLQFFSLSLVLTEPPAICPSLFRSLPSMGSRGSFCPCQLSSLTHHSPGSGGRGLLVTPPL